MYAQLVDFGIVILMKIVNLTWSDSLLLYTNYSSIYIYMLKTLYKSPRKSFVNRLL